MASNLDKLQPQQREAVKKLSTLRLTCKLIEAGEDEETITQMDRTALLEAWAGYILAGTDKQVEEVATSMRASVGYDPEVEKRRLDLE